MAEAKQIDTSSIVQKVQNLIRRGDIDGAIIQLLKKGENLAQENNVDEAIASFQRAKALDPSLDFDPVTKAKKIAAGSLVRKGENLARRGNIVDALAAVSKAQILDPSVEIKAKT